MSAVEFSPQSAGVINVEQSEAARARDTDIGVATISAKAATLHNRMLDFLVFITVITLRFSHDQQTHTVEFERLLSRSMTGPSGLWRLAAIGHPAYSVMATVMAVAETMV
jgi:hypothetical protein